MTLRPVLSMRILKALPAARYGTKSTQAGEERCACPSKTIRPGQLWRRVHHEKVLAMLRKLAPRRAPEGSEVTQWNGIVRFAAAR
jgi:hypothetical protein